MAETRPKDVGPNHRKSFAAPAAPADARRPTTQAPIATAKVMAPKSKCSERFRSAQTQKTAATRPAVPESAANCLRARLRGVC